MESCKEVFDVLNEYLDLDLPEEACRQIEQHITGCSPCEEFVLSLRKTVDLCKRYRPADMPKPISDAARSDLKAAYEKMLASRR